VQFGSTASRVVVLSRIRRDVKKATSSKPFKGTTAVSGKKDYAAGATRHPASVPERARLERTVSPDIYQIVVTCRDENEQKRLFQQLRKKHRVRLFVL
jgi:hypothetical protein